MKAKFICYHLKNTGEICGNGSTNPEGCHLHCKAKKRRPCSVCGRPTKVDKPTGIANDLCSKCNKSNYQIRHVNMLRDNNRLLENENALFRREINELLLELSANRAG
jgi:hypothetical protein